MLPENIDKENKKILAKVLNELKLMPKCQGEIVINISPDLTISTIKVTTIYR